MAAKTGSLSINSENIFPIIKKWLYSDHDIFYRELISNGCDAITKLKKLELMGEFVKPEELEYKIQVTVDSNAKTISVEDNGIGMTAEEVEEYILSLIHICTGQSVQNQQENFSHFPRTQGKRRRLRGG